MDVPWLNIIAFKQNKISETGESSLKRTWRIKRDAPRIASNGETKNSLNHLASRRPETNQEVAPGAEHKRWAPFVVHPKAAFSSAGFSCGERWLFSVVWRSILPQPPKELSWIPAVRRQRTLPTLSCRR